MSETFKKLEAEMKSGFREDRGPTNPDEFRKIVEARRSIRVFDGTPIPESVVQDVLDLTLLAPNSSNLQPWEFHWIRSPEVKHQVVQACLNQPAAATAAELFVCVARTGTWRQNAKNMIPLIEKHGLPVPQALKDYYNKLVPIAYATGPFGILTPFKWLLVNTVGFFRPMPRDNLGPASLKLWAHKTTALACENMMLGFTAHGFDTCPMEGMDSRMLKKILRLPRDASIVMVISAGRRVPEKVYGPRTRFPKEQFIFEH